MYFTGEDGYTTTSTLPYIEQTARTDQTFLGIVINKLSQTSNISLANVLGDHHASVLVFFQRLDYLADRNSPMSSFVKATSYRDS